VRDAEHERVRPTLRLKDEPLRLRQTILSVRKSRCWCSGCKKPFTEPLPGVRKGYRTTERYRPRVLWACETFSDLKSVRATYRCSSGLVHRVLGLLVVVGQSGLEPEANGLRRVLASATNTDNLRLFWWFLASRVGTRRDRRGHARTASRSSSCRRARLGAGLFACSDDFFQARMGYSLGARPFGVPHTEWTVICSGCSL
jgi:hypothetical protein